MEIQNLKSFLDTAEKHVVSVRSSLLIVAQNGNRGDELAVAARSLRNLKDAAERVGLTEVSARVADCERALDSLLMAGPENTTASYAALDLVSEIEAALLAIPFDSDELIPDIESFVDAGFDNLIPSSPDEEDIAAAWLSEEFDVDEETLDIFRGESAELLAKIETDLARLKASDDDQTALWDIRRSAHTFKGAAGIVGLKDASEIAHRMEDLLDKLVELGRKAGPNIVELLTLASGNLGQLVGTRNDAEPLANLDAAFAEAIERISTGETDTVAQQTERKPGAPPPRPPATPIVRVSLDRLDGLIRLAGELAANRSALQSEISNANSATVIADLLNKGQSLSTSLTHRLRGIRMQRFGTLETRLNRAVHVTCQEEGKQARLVLENGDTEIDTLLIDALVEPLLHLLRNSVVHGIESPETRRLIGKPERGTLTVNIRKNDTAVMMSIADDGRGIVPGALRQKAVTIGMIPATAAEQMDDEEALELIFSRGLTTANTINMNAGRGIGMAIVKESIETLGGRVQLTSEPQKGTRFLLTVPLEKAEPHFPSDGAADTDFSNAPLVLIVDDSASIRRHTTKLAESAGCRTISAIDGVEAMEILLSGNWRPDLIFSDVEMPRMDGWELLTTIKESYELNSIPVVLVTSLDAEEHRSRAFRTGAADYLVKPITMDRLAPLVSKMPNAAVGSA